MDNQRDLFEGWLGFYIGRETSCPVVPPEHVYFSLTNRCNLRCKMCSVSESGNGAYEMSLEEIKEIIRQIKSLGVRHLILSGGEVMLRGDIREIIDFSISCGIEMVDIITNGTLLDAPTLEYFISAGLNHLTISLDGLRRSNDYIRGEGVFAKAEAAMEILKQLKMRKQAERPTLGINFTIMDRNIEDILPMVDFASGKKCNIVVFQPVLFDNVKMHIKQRSPLWPSGERLQLLEQSLRKLRELKTGQASEPMIYTSDPVLNAMPAYFRGRMPLGRLGCYEGIKRMVITSSGQVWSCSGIYGDARKESLLSIWKSSAALQMREKAKRCKRHCLQDCVYFPASIFEEAKKVFSAVPRGEQREQLLISLDKTLGDFEKELGYSYSGIFQRIHGRRIINSVRTVIKSAAQD